MSHTEYSAQFVQYSSVFLGLEEAPCPKFTPRPEVWRCTTCKLCTPTPSASGGTDANSTTISLSETLAGVRRTLPILTSVFVPCLAQGEEIKAESGHLMKSQSLIYGMSIHYKVAMDLLHCC
jgi:hypothetical protein